MSNHTDRSNTLNGLSNRLSSFDKSLEKIDEILVELLKENNINYKDEEVKKEFIEFIKPTVFELTKKIVKN